MKQIVWASCLILLFWGCCASPSRHTPKQFISTLSLEERYLLEYFFRCLIQEDSIGYVLLEGKPMSFYSYVRPKTDLSAFQDNPSYELDLFFDPFHSRDLLVHRGFEVWKKYERQFCGKNIFFDLIEQDRELHYAKIVVLNKRLLLPLFDQYCRLDLLKRSKDARFTALLKDHEFKKRFYARHDLTGICLGYGQRNARLFQKMSDLLTTLGKLRFSLRELPMHRRQDVEENLRVLQRSFGGGFKDHISRKFLFTLGVGFRVDLSDVDTHSSQKRYRELRKQLTLAYSGGEFLEKTLELIQLADRAE